MGELVAQEEVGNEEEKNYYKNINQAPRHLWLYFEDTKTTYKKHRGDWKY